MTRRRARIARSLLTTLTRSSHAPSTPTTSLKSTTTTTPHRPPTANDDAEAKTLRTAQHLLHRHLSPAQARLELRWLRDHLSPHQSPLPRAQHTALLALCARRASGEPLQYILGSEFFGPLELRARPGVLIPRPDTAAAGLALARRLARASDCSLRLLDLCTGSGALALLLAHALLEEGCAPPRVVGVDVSRAALSLALENRRRIFPRARRCDVDFVQADVLAAAAADVETGEVGPRVNVPGPHDHTPWLAQPWDVVVASPPYLSPGDLMAGGVERSVWAFEPRAALVPDPSYRGRDLGEGEMHDDDDELGLLEDDSLRQQTMIQGAVKHAKAPPPDNIDHDQDDARIADLFYAPILSIAKRVGAKVVMLEVAGIEQARRVAARILADPYWTGLEAWRQQPSAKPVAPISVSTAGGPEFSARGEGEVRTLVAWHGVDGALWMRS